VTDEEHERLLVEIRDLLRERSACERAAAELAAPDWCRVTLGVAAQAIGYGASARPSENARRWLVEHDVTRVRVGKAWTCGIGDLRRALEAEVAQQKELDARVKPLTSGAT